MKLLLSGILLSSAALAQSAADGKIVTFSRTDAEHCRVVMANGKPLLESTYGGTSVAVGIPENKGNGEFAVYVYITQAGSGTAHVAPKDFSAVYSDPAHSRLYYFDKSAETGAGGQASAPGMSATGNEIDRSMIRGGPAGPGAAGPSPSDTLKGDNVPGRANPAPGGDTPAAPPVFLQSAKLKDGARAAGFVFFRRPKGSKLEVTPAGMLDEIDIPVNGVTFRF